MCGITAVFRTMIKDIKEFLENNPDIKDKFKNELNDTLSKVENKDKQVRRQELLRVIFKFIDSKKVLSEWFKKRYDDFLREVNCLVQFYAKEYLGFKDYYTPPVSEEEGDSVTSPDFHFAGEEFLSSSDLLLIEQHIQDFLFISISEHICLELTRASICKNYHYFFKWKGFIKGHPLPFLLYRVLAELKDFSPGIAKFLDKFVRGNLIMS